MMLTFENVTFFYDKKKVLQNFALSVRKGEILAVMGESGCGKSTLLNLASGLRKPKAGKILCNTKKISYVFQEPRLLPWLTVAENIRAILPKQEENEQAIADALQTVALSDAAELYPDELSGGMRTRASLARALAYGGELFLLDEPFAALNEELRRQLAVSMRQTFKQNGTSVILVTHQTADAELLADRIITL